MQVEVGVFLQLNEAKEALHELQSKGIKKNRITLLVPGDLKSAMNEIPTSETEQHGLAATIGGVVGASAGVGLGEMAAGVLLPGVGPVMGVGIFAAAIVGAAGGAAAGDALEKSMEQGLPIDEIFVYEDALRQGRSVVVVGIDNIEQKEIVQWVFADAGAESIDEARKKWWIGLRDVEREHYTAQGFDFTKDEKEYRRGFEAASHPQTRGKSFEESRAFLASYYPEIYQEERFRRGFERGQAYYFRMVK